MIDLTHHIATRDHTHCPVQHRAIAGADAAMRIQPEKQAYLEELEAYQQIETLYCNAGPNLRAVMHEHWEMARGRISTLFRAYDAVRGAEIISIGMEEAA